MEEMIELLEIELRGLDIELAYVRLEHAKNTKRIEDLEQERRNIVNMMEQLHIEIEKEPECQERDNE